MRLAGQALPPTGERFGSASSRSKSAKTSAMSLARLRSSMSLARLRSSAVEGGHLRDELNVLLKETAEPARAILDVENIVGTRPGTNGAAACRSSKSQPASTC
jgi:hypothetical protein